MTIKEAIMTLNANVVFACGRAGFDSATVKMVEDALDTIEDALEAQEPRIVTEADFENADEAGFIPAWCEEKDAGEVYCECISIGALEDAKFGHVRWWTFRPTDEQREAVPWLST